MAKMQLTDDFKEFLKLLTESDVRYLLIGGYAVGYYGYSRTTADMDIWVEVSPENAKKLVAVFKNFGFNDPKLNPDLFVDQKKIIRIGNPPVRIEVLLDIDGVEFEECYKNRQIVEIDNQEIPLISLYHLRKNKKASGRHKDIDDLNNLPEANE
jgi:predicted nucleotidyltransferase